MAATAATFAVATPAAAAVPTIPKFELRAIHVLLRSSVPEAVGRHRPGRAWDLATPAMRLTTTRADWRQGSLPVSRSGRRHPLRHSPDLGQPKRRVGQGAPPDRFFDALIGGGVALVLSQVLFRGDPVATVARAARPALDELAIALRETAGALANHNLEEAERALLRARSLDDEISEFYDALAVARETAWLSPARRRVRGRLTLYADAARQVDYAVRNTRVLARSAAAAIRKDITVDPELAASVATLATAVAEFAEQLADPDRTQSARRLAVRAAQKATDVLERQHDLSASMIVGQVRTTALDLLRGSGLDAEEARAALEEQEGDGPAGHCVV